jgi:YhcH/YjgK/YiaL family protein
MAIFGTIEILKKQTQNAQLLKALDFILKTDIKSVFAQVTPEKKQTIEIDGKKIFAIFQSYSSKLPDDTKIEGHKEYIDIQYIFSGEERILLASEKDIVSPDPYNSEKDVYFPKVKNSSNIQLRKGDAAILFPEDLHGPCCCIDKPMPVEKVVIKVAVN